MNRPILIWILMIAGWVSTNPKASAEDLRWETLRKTVAVKSTQTNATVSFWVTNVSARPMNIVRVKPSCGCTVAKNTRLPVHLGLGTATCIRLDTDVRGKRGILNKTAQVYSSAGVHVLNFKIAIGLEEQAMSRQRNLVLAQADPQAVFRDDCAKCHAKPTKGKTGKELYVTACGICHEAEHRASMVPDLKNHPLPQHLSQWLQLISSGKPNTLMPAFHEKHGGPLTAEQVRSLAKFMQVKFRESGLRR